MSYLDKLKEHLSETGPIEQPPKPPKPGLRGLSGSPEGPISGTQVVRRWRAGLAKLDPNTPRCGLSSQRWRQWIGDAEWFVDNFGLRAAERGWHVAELFGHVPGRDNRGGLVERLHSSRSLVMSDWHARWRSIAGVSMSFGRGCFGQPGGGENLPAGLVLMWEATDAG